MLRTFWDLLWLSVMIFLFVAYLMILFQVITDIFRDRTLSGVTKALWLVFLIFLPYLTAIIYLISRGDGIAERQHEANVAAKQAADNYIREVSGKSSASEIAEAKSLLDSGVISPAEFDRLKAKALS